MPKVKSEDSHVWHIFAIRTRDRDRLIKHLKGNGIETNIHYPTAPHKQECYKEWQNESFPISEMIHQQVLSLPISPVMTDEEVTKIIKVINDYE